MQRIFQLLAMKNIEDWSFGYEACRTLAKLFQRTSHREIEVRGKENIPKGKPLIFAPNHQNALSDSLAILLNTSIIQPVFLGRADMFKKKLVARILNFFRISPIYRIRDGKDLLDKNDEVFDTCIRILKKNKMLCLYPEAAHNGQKSMLCHKKAIPRIAFLAAEATNFEVDVQVVPVGIYYSHYNRFRRKLFVKFGKPIQAKDYYKLYQERGEAKAGLDFRKRIFDSIEQLVVHVKDKTAYDAYDLAFETMRRSILHKLKLKNKVENYVPAEQYINTKIETYFQKHEDEKENVVLQAKTVKRLSKKLDLPIELIQKGEMSFFHAFLNFTGVILLLPFGIYSLLVNGWLFYIAHYGIRKKVTDSHFWSTLSFGISFIFYPIWYIVQFFILYAIFSNWYVIGGILLYSLVGNVIAYNAFELLVNTAKRIRFTKLKRSENKLLIELLNTLNRLKSFYQIVLD